MFSINKKSFFTAIKQWTKSWEVFGKHHSPVLPNETKYKQEDKTFDGFVDELINQHKNETLFAPKIQTRHWMRDHDELIHNQQTIIAYQETMLELEILKINKILKINEDKEFDEDDEDDYLTEIYTNEKKNIKNILNEQYDKMMQEASNTNLDKLIETVINHNDILKRLLNDEIDEYIRKNNIHDEDFMEKFIDNEDFTEKFKTFAINTIYKKIEENN
jgi:uncharacterized protein YggL (DUF469 family)